MNQHIRHIDYTKRLVRDEQTESHVANCQICLLAENMKDCPQCRFNVGLAVKIVRRPFEHSDAALEYSELLKIAYAAHCQKSPVPAVDRERLEREIAEFQADHADWLDEMQTRESVRPF